MTDLLTEFTNALDCCGTCAGGVLARHVREAQAQAWDEGHAASERDWELLYDLATPDEDRQPLTNPYRS